MKWLFFLLVWTGAFCWSCVLLGVAIYLREFVTAWREDRRDQRDRRDLS